MKRFRYIWENFSSLGLQENMSYPLQQRIRLSNHLGLFVGAVASIFIFVLVLREEFKSMPPLFFLIGFSISIPIVNALGLHVISRLVIGIAPALGTFALNLSIKVNTPEMIGLIHYISPRMFLLSTIAIPIILFTSSESIYLIIALLIIMFMGTFGYEWAHEMYAVRHQDLNISYPFSSVIYEDIILMLITLLGALFYFRQLNYQYEVWTSNFLKEAQEKNQELNEKENSLERTLAEITQSRKEDERRSWEAKGLAKFANMLRSKTGDAKLYKELLSELVKYVKATQGAIYLVADHTDEPELVIEAAYAYNKKQYSKKSIKMGEGLVGQCLSDGKAKFLPEIPEDYAKVETGLGEMKPKSVLVLPLRFKEQTEGVIELTFINKLEDYKRDFLQRLTESIGTMIASDKANRKTQVLLTNSRFVTQELRKNEEILKQSLAELESSREKLARKEKEYLVRIKQLEERLIILNRKAD